ncbi:MAG: microcystin degradation protein MlrC [Chloroflexi bacterium]|nr:MAG: microcystin degradation protein MlrC [Chloroflexota bacterium]
MAVLGYIGGCRTASLAVRCAACDCCAERGLRMRFFTGGINHETSTFSPLPATLERFFETHYARGDELISSSRGTKTVIGGFIDAADALGIELVPTIHSFAMPSAAVTREAFETQMADTLDDLEAALAAGPLDGVLLGLHGAMVIEGIDDGEGEYLRRVREVVGPDVPIVTELDLHANISQESVELADLIVVYHLLARMVRKEINPTHAFRQIPVLANLTAQYTNRPPMRDWVALCHAIESRPGVLTASIDAGFPYADIPDTMMSCYVATDGDQALAEQYANELAQFAWDNRAGFQATPLGVDEAVVYAMSQPGPICLADIADNTGAGSSGDGTEILRALLRHGARSAVVALVYDPEVVRQAVAAGVGSTIDVVLGGKVDDRHGAPVETSAYVRAITDGRFVNDGPLGTGSHASMGVTAVLVLGGDGGIEVIVTSYRYAPNDANALRSVGIEPTKRQIVVIKSAVHYRADFEPIMREIVEVNAPGLSSPDWSRFTYRRLRRPIYPLDPEMEWSPQS